MLKLNPMFLDDHKFGLSVEKIKMIYLISDNLKIHLKDKNK